MSMFSRKPLAPLPAPVARPARSASSPASAPGRRPAPSATSPQPSPSSPQESRGTTVQEGVKGRQIYEEAKAAHHKAQEAVNYLEAMNSPKEGEQPTQLQEVVDSLALMLTEVRSLREEVRELRALVLPPSRRAPA